MSKKIIATFDGGYERIGTIGVTIGTCSICKKEEQQVIEIDASEEEYKSGCVCFSCCTQIWYDELPNKDVK